MPYVPQRGATLLIPSGTPKNQDQFHLHIILTDACKDNRRLLVNITTVYSGAHYDRTCVIEPGEHDFVIDPSYVVYRRAKTSHMKHLTICVDGWVFRPHDPVSSELFNRICGGVEASSFTPRDMKGYFRQNRK